jgi:hypothetical protein
VLLIAVFKLTNTKIQFYEKKQSWLHGFILCLPVKAQLVNCRFKGGLCQLFRFRSQFDALPSYHAGLVWPKLVDTVSLQPELLSLHKALPIKCARRIQKIGYLALPVMAKIYLNKSVRLLN